MIVTYRGHEIDVHRAKALGGWSQLYYSVFRVKDWRECTSGHTDDASTVREYVSVLKRRVDAELADPDPWGEKAAEYPLGYMQQRGAA